MTNQEAHELIDWTSRPEIRDFPWKPEHQDLIDEAYRVVNEAKLRFYETARRKKGITR